MCNEAKDTRTYGQTASPQIRGGLTRDMDKAYLAMGAGTYRPPLKDIIEKQQADNQENFSNNERAIAILKAHPEFEDFLWLFNNYKHCV